MTLYKYLVSVAFVSSTRKSGSLPYYIEILVFKHIQNIFYFNKTKGFMFQTLFSEHSRAPAHSFPLRATNFSKKAKFKAVWSNLVHNKIQVIIQDNKLTYYKIEGFFTINHWKAIVIFTHSNHFNSEILILYLSFLIYIYKYIFV